MTLKNKNIKIKFNCNNNEKNNFKIGSGRVIIRDKNMIQPKLMKFSLYFRTEIVLFRLRNKGL